MNLEQFAGILQACLENDKNARLLAEKQLESFKESNPVEYAKALVKVSKDCDNPVARSMSIILLRPALAMTPTSVLQHLSPELMASFQAELLEALKKEQVKSVRNKLVYTIATFLSTPLRQGRAPNLIPTLCEWTKDPLEHTRQSAFALLNQLSYYILDHGLQPYIQILYKTLELGMQEHQPRSVQVAALLACTNLAKSLKKKNQDAIVPLTQNMLEVLGRLLNQHAEEEALTVIEAFIEILTSKPRFFQKTKLVLLSAMLQIAKSTQFHDETLRFMAMEWVCCLVEQTPTITKTMPNFANEVIPVCLDLITSVSDEDEEWATTFEESDDEITLYDIGIECLDRICRDTMRPEAIAEILFNFYQSYAASENWRLRYACAMSVAQSVEGCVNDFAAKLPQIVSMLLGLAKDPSAKVRFAVVQSFAQIANELSPTFQEEYHSEVIPAILALMDDPVHKIKAHAATSIVNYTGEIEKEIIEPYVDQLLGSLYKLLQTNIKFIQEQAIIAICGLVDCTHHLFLKYYDYFMPLLIQILQTATDVHYRMFRARAIECVSLIAVAVGKKNFKDFNTVLDIFLRIQKEATDDDPAQIYLVQSWSRLARCLKEDFVPLLPDALSQIFKKAQLEPQFCIVDADEEKSDFEKNTSSQSLTIEGVGVKRVSFKTSEIEEKALAITQILNFLDLLEDHMFQYVSPIAQIAIPQLETALIDDIRMTVSEISTKLVSMVKKQVDAGKVGPEILSNLFQFLFTTIVNTLLIDGVDSRTEIIIIDCLQESLKSVKNILHQDQINQISDILLATLKRSLINKDRYYKESLDEDEELEILEKLEGKILTEENLQSTIGDVVGSLLQSHHSLFINIFLEKFLNIFKAFIHQKASDDEICIGLCVLCDYIEFGGESFRDFDTCFSLFQAFAHHSSVGVVNAAMYGLGCLAANGCPQFENVIPSALKTLEHVIAYRFKKGGKKFGPAVTNAVSTLYKIIECRGHNPAINVNDMLSGWSKLLPVTDDWVEAKIVHAKFLKLVEMRHPSIIGENFSELPHIMNVLSLIANSLGLEQSDNAIIKRIISSLQNDVPELLQKACAALPEKQQRKLTNLMSEFD